MNKHRFLLLAGLLLVVSFPLQAQSPAADSLQALLLAHPSPDTTRLRLLNDLAYEIRNEDIRSQSLSEQALSLARQLRRPSQEALALRSLSYAKSRAGAHAQAIDLGRQACALADRTGDPLVRAKTHQMFGFINYRKGDYGQALPHFQQALKLARQARTPPEESNALRGIALVYQNTGDYPQSLAYALQALEAFQRDGDGIKEASTLANIGGIYALLGDYPKSLAYIAKAKQLAQKLDNKTIMHQALSGLGETYRLQGNYPQAIEAYQQAIALSRQLQDLLNEYLNLSNLADVYQRQGNYSLAIAEANRALAYFAPTDDQGDISWCRLILAQAYRHTGQLDSARLQASQSLKLAQEAGMKDFIRDANQVLSQVYVQQKDFAQAYYYQQQYTVYKDSLSGEETSRQVAVLQYNADLEKKQAQIALLQKDKQLQAEASSRQRQLLYGLLAGFGLVFVLVGALVRNNRNKQRANALLEQQKSEIDGQAHRLQGLNDEPNATNEELAQQTEEVTAQRDNLAQSYRNVELLGEIGKQITASLSVETILSTVYENVNSLMDAAVFGIGLYNEQKQQVDYPATQEKGERLPFYSNALSDADRLDGWCFRHRQEIHIGDFSQEYNRYITRIQAPKAGEQAASILYLPLIVKDKAIGVITVQSFQPNAYSDYHVYILRNLAIYTAIALENAEAYQRLNQTLVSLTNAQAQLVQHEKMASLGELTAGIAHEIQNPLNFVNNFAEVSVELVGEMVEALQKIPFPSLEKEYLVNTLTDLSQNQQKIHFHGQRADRIVKGMLQHARSATSERQATDLNALTDEYLRLAYHGLRAKDKDFNASLVTLFDEKLEKVSVVPQEMGRVLLNLFNNAFYAVQQKQQKTQNGYQPQISVSTVCRPHNVEIRVRDNGMGIAESAKQKIFQPFFTTKPAGQGTGLGLSMSYDIITKGHGGELRVETKEGEFSEFIVSLPAREFT